MLIYIIFPLIIIMICFLTYQLLIEYIYCLSPKKRKEIELKLSNQLKKYAQELSISINYEDDLGDAAGRLVYSIYKFDKESRIILNSDIKIQILNIYKNSDWDILAHELGHYIALKNNNDSSEYMANIEGLRLCEGFLTKTEQRVLKIPLDCHFRDNIKSQQKINRGAKKE